MVIAMARALPADAQQEDYDGTYKSYTLRDPNHEGYFHASIGVLVDKQAFYVCPVEKLPGAYKDLYKINKQKGITMSYGRDYVPEEVWKDAKKIALWEK